MALQQPHGDRRRVKPPHPTLIPAPSRHSCAGRNPPAHPNDIHPSTPIHPSPLPGGEVRGVRGNERRTKPAPPSFPPLSRHSCTGRSSHPNNTHPFPNSSLPPSRGEVRWGVRGREPAPPVAPRTIVHVHPSALLHPSRHSCVGRNPRAHSTPSTRHTHAPPRVSHRAPLSQHPPHSLHATTPTRVPPPLRRNDGMPAGARQRRRVFGRVASLVAAGQDVRPDRCVPYR